MRNPAEAAEAHQVVKLDGILSALLPGSEQYSVYILSLVYYSCASLGATLIVGIAWAIRRSYSSRRSLKRMSSAITPWEETEALQLGYVDDVIGTVLLYMCHFLIVLFHAGCVVLIFRRKIFKESNLEGMFCPLILTSTALFPGLAWLPNNRQLFLLPAPLGDASAVVIKEAKSNLLSKRFLLEVEREGSQRFIVHLGVRLVWKENAQRFRPNGSMTFVCNQISTGGLDTETASARLAEGKNTLDIRGPSLGREIRTQFGKLEFSVYLHTMYLYCFRGGCIAPSMVIAFILVSGLTQAYSSWRRQEDARPYAANDGRAIVRRDGEWVSVSSAELVVQDVFAPSVGILPVDCVLVEGTATTREAMLTGEAMPQRKTPLEPSLEKLNIGTHRKNILFAGTELLQADDAICSVIATGSQTEKGRSLRMTIFLSPIPSTFDAEIGYRFLVASLYSVCLMIAMVYYGYSLKTMVFSIATVITQLLSPLLPTALANAQSAGVAELNANGITCSSPSTLSHAGELQVAVFDKTGTLTKTYMSLAALQPERGGAMEAMKTMPILKGSRIKLLTELGEMWLPALATCHEVADVDDKLVGADLEMRMLQASGWKFAQSGKAQQRRFVSSDGSCSAEVLRVLDFDHSRMTSGALVRLESGETSKVVFFIKGAGQHVKATLREVPRGYDEALKAGACKGFYILGLAYLDVEDETVDLMMKESRDAFVKKFTLLGFLHFKNELDDRAAEAIIALTEGGIHTCMCTGDGIATAVSVGKQCNMVRNPVLVGNVEDGTDFVTWSTEDGEVCDASANSCADYDLAVSGDAFRVLQTSGQLHEIQSRIRVFGRMLPDQKVSVIRGFQKCGFVVGMCGDGGNDCAALRAAHVGVSFAGSVASASAVFNTETNKPTQALVSIVRVGRAVLSTNMSSFKFFISAGLYYSTTKVILLACRKENWGEWHYNVLLFVYPILVSWAATNTCDPLDTLGAFCPTSSSFSIRTLMSIMVPYMSFVAAIYFVYHCLLQAEWRSPLDIFTYRNRAGYNVHAVRADNYFTASCFLLIAPYMVFMALIFHSFTRCRQVFSQKTLKLSCVVLAIVSFQMVLLHSGPSPLTCVFRVNCANSVAKNTYVLFLTELSFYPTDYCFFGPQANIWMNPEKHIEAFGNNETAAQRAIPYKLSPYSKPKCEPPADSGLPHLDPNNVFYGHWALTLTLLLLVLVAFNLLFIWACLDPLANWLGQLPGTGWTESRMHHKLEGQS